MGLNFKIRLKIRSVETIHSILNLKVIGKFNKEIVQTLNKVLKKIPKLNKENEKRKENS